jgi:K+/H+ antiporter YhaU regulatory subunit KhtT
MALHRKYSIRFTEKESIELDYLLHKYGFQKVSSFIKKCIFKKEFHVVTYDESLYDVIDMLNDMLYQYRKIGENYNQVVKQIHKAFNEEKGKQLLGRLAQNTIDLVQITEKTVVPIVRTLEEKYDSKNQYKQ